MLALLLLAAIAWFTLRDDAPDSVANARLAGPRSPVPVSVVLLLDQSGSFTEYEAIRRQALNEILTWSEGNLRDDDVVTAIAFAEHAGIVLAPTTVAQLAATPPQIAQVTLNDTTTAITDGLELASTTVDLTMPQSLVVVTDTMIRDADPTRMNQLVKTLNATTMTVITPEDVDITPEWADSFPYEYAVTASTDSTTDTSLAIASAIAHATGQRLEKID